MNPGGYSYPSVGDIALALEKGLLSKAEARAAVLEWFPAAKQLADAKLKLDAAESA